ncbi:MAG: thioredoxin domain-containing protein, partial [Desulfuromusa sp.]|nr:thioredoxin domain-containing protein [Desulfuromusa sp.]
MNLFQTVIYCTLPLTVGLTNPSTATAEKSNRLIHEQSPYLLQHAHNPVDWFPWGDEAFAKAKESGKLIFLSIGYSTCHWCHVMEAESFEDDEVAALLLQDYIAIKVDREERPDIDQFYMQVAMQLNGSGG